MHQTLVRTMADVFQKRVILNASARRVSVDITVKSVSIYFAIITESLKDSELMTYDIFKMYCKLIKNIYLFGASYINN